MHIKGFEDVISKNSVKTNFAVEINVHRLAYTLGNGTQYKVNVVAEDFETAQAIIEKKYGGQRGFNIYEYEVARPEHSIHVISPVMKRKIYDALHDEFSRPAPPEKPTLMDKLVRGK
jgi:hypothetical protein